MYKYLKHSLSSPFANSKPDNANNTNPKSKDERDHDQNIPIVAIHFEPKELRRTKINYFFILT
jgi:hypothetical protein